MDEIKNVLICGLGAVGSIYAVKIKNYQGASLKILVDNWRLARYKNSPLIFNGTEYNFDYIQPSETDFKADLIIIATKFFGLGEAVENIKNFVKDDTIILSLLNGVTSEEILAKNYGADKIPLSYCICHSAVRKGRNVTHDGVSTIVFGTDRSSKQAKNNILKLQTFFDKANIDYKIPVDMRYSLWLKFMLNVCANQSTALLRMTFGEMLENDKFMEFAVNIMKEVQLIAKAEGVNNTENMIEKTIENLHSMIPDGKTSMLQDVEAGRKTEADMFAGTIVKLGLKHGIPTPYNKVFKEMFDIIHKNQELKQLENSVSC